MTRAHTRPHRRRVADADCGSLCRHRRRPRHQGAAAVAAPGLFAHDRAGDVPLGVGRQVVEAGAGVLLADPAVFPTNPALFPVTHPALFPVTDPALFPSPSLLIKKYAPYWAQSELIFIFASPSKPGLSKEFFGEVPEWPKGTVC